MELMSAVNRRHGPARARQFGAREVAARFSSCLYHTNAGQAIQTKRLMSCPLVGHLVGSAGGTMV